jgi:hypothetical protein
MHQSVHLHRRVLHRALVRLERSAVKVARCVLRGERSRKAPDLPGVRQAKLGASCRVEVPAEEGLTNHSYRVLQLWRKQRCRAERYS